MRVLVATPLYPPSVGGPATYSRLLEVELPGRGTSVDVVSFGSVRRLPKGIRHALYLTKLLWWGVRADVIFALDPVSVGYPASIAARLLRKPLVLKIVGDYSWEQGVQRFGVKDLLDKFTEKAYGAPVERLRRVQSAVASCAKKIIVPSEYLKKIIASWGVEAGKIEVIYNAVETPADLPSREKAREMFEIGESEFVILSAGRNVPWKGFEVLRGVVADLETGFPSGNPVSIRLEIFHSLPHREVLTWMRAADIFVLNSGYEGFPHIVLEAMALGTPVIASRAGGNPEVVRDGENGLLVDYNNRGQLKTAILKLYGDESLREKLALVGQKTALKFSKDRMINETLNVITDM